jgi:type I restriction enzyme M protein
LSNEAKEKKFIEENYYLLDFTLDKIRPAYRFDVSCQGSVPQAIEAFLESTGFEDAIRGAISIGGDSDTIAAITGSIAEAYYGIPVDIRTQALLYLDEIQTGILSRFEEKYGMIRDRSRKSGGC